MSNYVLKHHGIKGQKWGVRRFQDYSGRLLDAGRKRYGQLKEVGEYATRTKGWGNVDRINRGKIQTVHDKNGRPTAVAGFKTESSVDNAVKLLSSVSKNAINSYAKKGRELYSDLKFDAEHLTRDSGWQKNDQYTPKFSNREYLAFRTMDKGGVDYTNRYYRNNPNYTGTRPAYASELRAKKYEAFKKNGLSDSEATKAVYGSELTRRFFNGEFERPGDVESRRRNPYYW